MNEELKVRYTGEERDVPYTGRLIPDHEYTLPSAIAQELIDTGQAELVEQED